MKTVEQTLSGDDLWNNADFDNQEDSGSGADGLVLAKN